MRTFHLEIVTPDGRAFDGEAESLLVHTTEGDVEILCGHMDYLAAIGTGRARILVNGEADRKSTRLNSSHLPRSRMPSSA